MKKLIATILAVVMMLSVCIIAPATANASEINSDNDRLTAATTPISVNGLDISDKISAKTGLTMIIGIIAKYSDTIVNAITPESLDKVQAYVDKATLVAVNPFSTDEECTFALYNLIMSGVLDVEIIYNNSYVEIYINVFQEIIDKAELLNLPAEVVQVIQGLIDEGKELVAKGNATEEEIKAYEQKIIATLKSIFETDNSGDPNSEMSLEEMVELAEEELNGSYDEADLVDLKQAIDEAKAVLNNSASTEEEKDNAYIKLSEAYDNLPLVIEESKKESLYSNIGMAVLYVVVGAIEEDADKAKLDTIRNDVISCEDVYLDVNSTDEQYDAAIMLIESHFISEVILYGDFNSDGELNIKDATEIQKYAADYEIVIYDITAGDVDVDNDITIKDATLIQKRLADQIEAFPVEIAVG